MKHRLFKVKRYVNIYFFYFYSKARPMILIVAKRSIKETFNEVSSSEFKYDRKPA